jgi:transcriptional regulator with XRE-family HTH domain
VYTIKEYNFTKKITQCKFYKMKNSKTLIRQSHFLGTKIRNLRKRNHLTLDDLSARCVKLEPEYAPSVSYLSMIERGNRVPSEDMLSVIAQVFQKPTQWFLDDASAQAEITPDKGSRGGIIGMALEPSFLFSNEILQIAIPEMLSQTGTSGRQFAHLLIRAHQEHHQNHFPDLERAAEEVGNKRMPLYVDDLMEIAQEKGLKINWFSKLPESRTSQVDNVSTQMVTSYFQPPSTIYMNKILKKNTPRLKYELAVHIGHCVLHNNDGEKSIMVAGDKTQYDVQNSGQSQHASTHLDAQDILHAWRDFECSFFAAALLCPKVAFRQLLDRHGYEVKVCKLIEVSESVVMRRMTAVSPYTHWHYFDAYSQGKLKAVYRGNGIPLPWGNMRIVKDPCQHWAVFRMLAINYTGTDAQISILSENGVSKIYCCESIKVQDLTNVGHVLCSGINLNPAIDAQGHDSLALVEELKQVCIANGGSAVIPNKIKKVLVSVAKILNINWIERGIAGGAMLICSRGSVCPRQPGCYSKTSIIDNDHEKVRIDNVL